MEYAPKINIFGLKMMVKSGQKIYFWNSSMRKAFLGKSFLLHRKVDITQKGKFSNENDLFCASTDGIFETGAYGVPSKSQTQSFWVKVVHLVPKVQTLAGHAVGTSVSMGRDVPGQTGTGRPVVPLSWDKNISLSRCPFVPGQGQEQKSRNKLPCPGTSRDNITYPKKTKKQEKEVLKQEKEVLKQERMF